MLIKPRTTTKVLLFLLTSLLGFAPIVSAQNVSSRPTNTSHPIYQKAEKELSHDWYVLYRVTERIVRANGLEQNPWRIVILPKYDINAFATEVNLVALYAGIVDQLSGDASALACLVGHEIAHHTHRHIALSEAQRQQRLKEIEAEAEAAIKEEIRRAQGKLTTNAILGSIFGVNTSGFSQRTIEVSRQRIEEIKRQKKEQFEREILENSRKQEFEADATGYVYAVTAGFEPEGCLRLLQVLARLPGSEFDTTHPNVPARIKAIEQLIVQKPAHSLRPQGQARLRALEPLTYSRSLDQQSLRVNSRFGSSQQDLKRLFGQ